ncbi:unnamed protein product [Lampetra planeri]
MVARDPAAGLAVFVNVLGVAVFLLVVLRHLLEVRHAAPRASGHAALRTEGVYEARPRRVGDSRGRRLVFERIAES